MSLTATIMPLRNMQRFRLDLRLRRSPDRPVSIQRRTKMIRRQVIATDIEISPRKKFEIT